MLLGSAAVALPLGARAQQGARKRRIGVLMALSESDPEAKPRVKAFEQGLQDWGWVKEQNLLIEYRWIGTDITQTQSHAAELATRRSWLVLRADAVS
jgi:putative ABC transport system substrate-binding protein